MGYYEKHLSIPLTGDLNIKFYTKQGLLVSNGYSRVVIGGRGPYVLFSLNNIIHLNFTIPKNEL